MSCNIHYIDIDKIPITEKVLDHWLIGVSCVFLSNNQVSLLLT